MKMIFYYIKLGLMLGLICGIAALALSATYSVTKERVEQQKQRDILSSLPVVLPAADQFSEEQHVEGIRYYIGKAQDILIGYAVYGEVQGYQSLIKFMVGVDPEGVIQGLRVLEHGETPGLGARITELPAGQTLAEFIKSKFSKLKPQESTPYPWFPAMFIDKQYDNLYVSKIDTDKNAITAITGATITSQAVADGVKEVVGEFMKKVE